jgi:Carboxypeptidase regulatory-like domain/TonB dependent receptor
MNPITSGLRAYSCGLASRIALLLSTALSVLVFSVPLFSQGNFGRILGTVTDQTGGVISSATVTIIDKDRGVARTLTTDAAGEYNAPTLIPGTYIVRAEAQGFKRLERQNVVLEVGKEVRVDMTVQPGTQAQTVTVTEAVPLVETTNATLGGTLENAQIQDLPLNGRDYQNLLGLRPGVMLQPGGGPWTQSTNGVRPDESAWMIEGVMNANFYDARPVVGASSYITDAATILPIDAIQEFNLEENPKAEYGWKPGAVVNVGIRSGTNSLHGAAYAFGREDSFDARNIFNPGPGNGTCLPNPGVPAVCNKLPLNLEQFGGVIGGPIKKDKLFFFAGYEGLRDSIGNAFSTKVPELASQATAAKPAGDPTHSMVDAIRALQSATPAIPVSPVSLALLGCPSGTLTTTSTCTGGYIQGAAANSTGYLSSFPNINTSNNGIAKIDYRINSKHTIYGTLWIGDYNSPGGEDHAAVNANWVQTAIVKDWTAVGNWVWTPSSTVVNEARFGYTRATQNILPFDRSIFADGKSYPINTGITSYGGFPVIGITGYGQGNRPLGSWQGRPMETGPNPFFDGQDSVSYLKGKHAFKFGAEIAHIEADAFNHDTRGRIDFQGKQLLSGSSTPLEDFFGGQPSRGFLLIGDARRTVNWMSYAGFVQDDWRFTPKLIVNLGLRYSYTAPVREANNLLGSFDPTSTLGIVQEGQASVGNTLWKRDYKDFSPRLGLAWDVTGKGTTVVRAGASIIYSSFDAAEFLAQVGPNNFNGGGLGVVPTGACQTAVSPGGVCPATFGGTIALGSFLYKGSSLNWNGVVFPPAGALSCTAKSPCNIMAVDPNLRTPYITNWNLSVTHAFSSNLSLEVGYVGNHGSNLTGIDDINQANLATGVLPYAGKFPYLGFINDVTNGRISNYNGLQTTLTERVSHGLSFTAGYTYSHVLDDGSENRMGPLPQDSTNPILEYASSDFDVRNRFTLTASYDLPGKKGFGQLLEGWKINSIVNVQSAQPWNIADTSNNFSGTSENQDRWDFFGNPADVKSGANSLPYCTGFPGPVTCTSTSGIDGSVYTYPNSAALGAGCVAKAPDPSTLAKGGCFAAGNSVMVPPKAGSFGTMGRNIFRDNGFRNWDLSLFKNFTFKERFGAQFRFEMFNVLNRATISNPNGANNGSHAGDDPSAGTTFGCGCFTPDFATGNPVIGSGGNRAIQLGLKLTF